MMTMSEMNGFTVAVGCTVRLMLEHLHRLGVCLRENVHWLAECSERVSVVTSTVPVAAMTQQHVFHFSSWASVKSYGSCFHNCLPLSSSQV